MKVPYPYCFLKMRHGCDTETHKLKAKTNAIINNTVKKEKLKTRNFESPFPYIYVHTLYVKNSFLLVYLYIECPSSVNL
jgi:hypothetical protein